MWRITQVGFWYIYTGSGVNCSVVLWSITNWKQARIWKTYFMPFYHDFNNIICLELDAKSKHIITKYAKISESSDTWEHVCCFCFKRHWPQKSDYCDFLLGCAI